MSGNGESVTYACRLCGGKIEGHRVSTDAVIRGTVTRTTCAQAGADLDARATQMFPSEPTPTWEARLGRECAERREAARSVWQQPLRGER